MTITAQERRPPSWGPLETARAPPRCGRPRHGATHVDIHRSLLLRCCLPPGIIRESTQRFLHMCYAEFFFTMEFTDGILLLQLTNPTYDTKSNYLL